MAFGKEICYATLWETNHIGAKWCGGITDILEGFFFFSSIQFLRNKIEEVI